MTPTASYVLHIQGHSVSVISRLGESQAAGQEIGVDWVAQSNALRATPLGNVTGEYFFEFVNIGNMFLV